MDRSERDYLHIRTSSAAPKFRPLQENLIHPYRGENVLEIPFFRDFLYGLRLLRRSPTFYLLGVLILSLGIGATTAIFSLIDGVLLHPLPYRDPARLAVIWSDFSRQGATAEL